MDLNRLNQKQKEAVLAEDKAILVLAGAGSGKTRVLTQRIARLILDGEIDKNSVLAFTFTNKAAKEMKDRVAKELKRPVDSMWIGTFHSICNRILRRDIGFLGYNSNFTIYDSTDQKTLVKQIIKKYNYESLGMSPAGILAGISDLKNRAYSPEEAANMAKSPIETLVSAIFLRYEEEKKKNNALDFDDLILKSLEILNKSEEIRKHYRQRFSHIFVDEYQDTNQAQYRLILALCGPDSSIFAVGDADQSIYGWRGADISNILNFERDFKGARTILLEQNYRSSKKILNAANILIKNNIERKDKRLWTENAEGCDVSFKVYESEYEEAQAVLSNIEKEKAAGRSYKDQAILYRTNAQSRAFEEALIREGIPYRIVGGLKFYDRAEIKDLVAYMKLIVNPGDDLSFERVINRPKRGIGAKSLQALKDLAFSNGMALMDSLREEEIIEDLGPAQRKKFLTFLDFMDQAAGKISEPISEIAKFVYEASGYKSMLETSPNIEDKSRIENISSFYDAIVQYEEFEEEANLVDYLQNLSLMSDLDKTEEARDGVTLLTMHSAKGLEFPIVYLVGLEEGLFPSQRSMEEGNLEEERRLMYVAITRAEAGLYLSAANARRVYGTFMPSRPSRFIEELGDSIEKEEILYSGGQDEGYGESSGGQSGHAYRKGFADPAMRREYDKQRARIREMIRAEKADRTGSGSANYRVGDKVSHKKFGKGTVVSVMANSDGDEITVAFENKGLKRLRADIAPLVKVN